MKFGFARANSKYQILDLQVAALQAAGCKKIIIVGSSSWTIKCPELASFITLLKRGDIVVVGKLVGLGQSLKDLVACIALFEKLGVNFISLCDGIDTRTTTGRLYFKVFMSLVEFERDIVSERTKIGLASAWLEGRKGGRPAGLSKDAMNKAQTALKLYKKGGLKMKDIANSLGVSRVTCYRYINMTREQRT